MRNNANADVGCLLLGEYVDEAELPKNLTPGSAEVVRPQVVSDYLDFWAKDNSTKDFTVLLKDGRIVSVQGHSLKHLPPTAAGEGGSYGIIVRAGTDEMLVALFKIIDVVGIFHGEMRCDQKIA